MCKAATPSPSSWTFNDAYRELREQLKTSVPAIVGMLINKIPWLLSLHFVGQIGEPELAAAALATTLCNVTGMSLSVGLSSGLSTLTGQARGKQALLLIQKQQGDIRKDDDSDQETLISQDEDDDASLPQTVEHETLISKNEEGVRIINPSAECKDKPAITPLMSLVYLYRGLAVQLLFVLPVGIWWLTGIESFLLALGQGPELSRMTQDYLRILVPGLWAYSINWTMTTWLHAMEMADVPASAAAVASLLHIPFNLLLIPRLGYLGVGVATVLTQSIQPFYQMYYLLTQRGSERVLKQMMAPPTSHLSFWLEASLAIQSMSGILRYLSLALPGIVIISEWWASEISIFLSGTLAPWPEAALGGMTLYQSINTFFFMFPMGCSVAGATRVGKALGAGDARAASMSATVSVSTAALLSFGMGSFLYFAPHTMLPSLFTREPDVVHQASQLITLLAFYVFADGVQAALNGIIRGCGRQCVIMPVVVVAYWVVGLPLSYYWAFMRHDGYMCDDSPTCGVNGLVMGMTIGTWTHMLLMLLLVVATTDWEIQSERAIQRLAQDDTTINDTKPTTLQIKEQSAIKPTIESSTVCVIQL